MLGTSGDRIRVECNPVAVKASFGRSLFFIKFPQVDAVSDMRVVDLPLSCVHQGDLLRGIRFLKSHLQA